MDSYNIVQGPMLLLPDRIFTWLDHVDSFTTFISLTNSLTINLVSTLTC